MTQNAPPIIDLVTGNWEKAPLYAKIDEPTASDSDYISTGEDPYQYSFTVKLAPLDPPEAGSHKLTVRLRKRGSDDITVLIELLEGVTVVASKTVGPTGGVPTASFANYELQLSQAEIDSIHNYAALSIRVTATGPAFTHERRTLDGELVWSAAAPTEVLYITKVGGAVYTAGIDNTIRKWNAATGAEDTSGNWPVADMPGRLLPASDGSHLICHRERTYQPAGDIPMIAKISSTGTVVWEANSAVPYGVLPLDGKIYVIIEMINVTVGWWVIDEADGSDVIAPTNHGWPILRQGFEKSGTHYIPTVRELAGDNLLVFGAYAGLADYPGFIQIQKSDGTLVQNRPLLQYKTPSTHEFLSDGSTFQITLASGVGGTGLLARWAHNPIDDFNPVWSISTGYGGRQFSGAPSRPPRLYLQGDEVFVCGVHFNDFHLDGSEVYTCHKPGSTGKGDLLVKAFSVTSGSETRHWVV